MKYPDCKLLAAVTPRKSILYSSLLIAGLVAGSGAQAATLSNGDILTITAGVSGTNSSGTAIVTGGSYFGMDTNKDSKISPGEKNVVVQGTTGLVIGVVTTAGASHSGAPVAGDTNAIDAPWTFFGNTGSDFAKIGVTGGTTAGLDMSGWTVTWNGIPAINMSGGAWQPLNCSALGCTGHTFTNGNAMLTWTGSNGGAYTLNYAATVPAGDPSGFGGVQYFLHLEGTVIVPPALTCSNGATCTVSPTSGFSSTRIGDAELTGAGIPLDTSSTDYYPLHLYYDFSVPVGNGIAEVVIPLSNPLPANAVYRLYNNGSWQDFQTPLGGSDAIASAPGTLGSACPAPGSTSYTTGLTQGNNCVELTISLNGPNNTDPTRLTISDPGTIATTSAPAASAPLPARTSGSSGCSISPTPVNPLKRGDWWILLGFVAWLGFWRRKRHS